MKELRDGVYWVGATDWKVRHIHGNELSTIEEVHIIHTLLKMKKRFL